MSAPKLTKAERSKLWKLIEEVATQPYDRAKFLKVWMKEAGVKTHEELEQKLTETNAFFGGSSEPVRIMRATPQPKITTGQTSTTYSYDQFCRLRQLLEDNGNTLWLGLPVFLAEARLNHEWIFWLEMAEKIKDDPSFPEKHFPKPI